jgi:hypothetical protein
LGVVLEFEIRGFITMEIDPLDIVEKSDDYRTKRLNMLVAITVAILATFMGICKVKDDNIVQNMQQAQANKIDHWAFYQARNIREEIAKATAVQLRLAVTGSNSSQTASYQQAIEEYEKTAKEQHQKKDELSLMAAQDQKDYDASNFRDDQFDLSDALIAIAISLLALTALTHQYWLYLVAMIPTGFGIFMGLSGLLEWPFHPTILVRLLS